MRYNKAKVLKNRETNVGKKKDFNFIKIVTLCHVLAVNASKNNSDPPTDHSLETSRSYNIINTAAAATSAEGNITTPTITRSTGIE